MPEFSITEVLSQLRLRLLDLTARNRLLNFKPSSTKTLQVVDAVPDAIFTRLLDNHHLVFIPVPDPDPTEYLFQENRRQKPQIREYAERLGIGTSYDLSPRKANQLTKGTEGAQLRVLFYPEDLERQCRRIAREAQSAIEETGTNMLYLVIGFLEFYETDDAERPLNAPLIAVPASLKRGSIDRGTRLYKYELSYTGEEITQNLSLREKLKTEFGIQLPDLGENDHPEDYFERISDVIRRKSRWKVKRQITLTLLSFAKMMLVQDIDPKNWPQGQKGPTLTEHPIVRQVFEGGGNHDDRDPDDYLIDERKENSLPIIYDADTSQHSALIDALAGKNLVVNGPPGTGKSQTITNLIAAAMVEGKKVLFVSEKLAALEVVKNRLEQVDLGDFCLELHSHKTDKKRVVEEIKKRKDKHYVTPRALGEKLETLDQRRKRLKRYADLINSRIGNELSLSVFEILWQAERHRQDADLHAACLEYVVLDDAPHTAHGRLDEMLRAVSDLARQHQEIGAFGPTHPWYGFFLDRLNPGDDLAIQKLLVELIEETMQLDAAMVALREAARERVLLDMTALANFVQSVEGVKEPGPRVLGELLPRFFSSADPKARLSKNVVEELKKLCDDANSLADAWADKLFDPDGVTEATIDVVRADMQTLRGWKLSKRTLEELENAAATLRTTATGMQGTLAFFSESAVLVGLPFDGTDASLQRLREITNIAHQAPQDLLSFRHPGLNQPLAKEVLFKAREHLLNAKRQRQTLEELFWLDESPSEEEVQEAIHILRRGDTWYRFLQSDWRRACRFHRTLTREKKTKKSSEDRLNELTGLAEHIKTLRQFQESKEYKETFGRLFQGTETDFEKAERLVSWYERGRETLLHLGLNPAEFDLNTFDGFMLSQLALRSGACQAHFNAIRDAAGSEASG